MTDLNQEFGSVPPPPREDDIDRQSEHVAEVIDGMPRGDPPPPELVDEVIDGMPRGDPPPELVEAVVRHYVELRAELQARVGSIESILGFIRDDNAALAVRVAKVELFLGLKA